MQNDQNGPGANVISAMYFLDGLPGSLPVSVHDLTCGEILAYFTGQL